jgi:hypothetical protein
MEMIESGAFSCCWRGVFRNHNYYSPTLGKVVKLKEKSSLSDATRGGVMSLSDDDGGKSKKKHARNRIAVRTV